VNKRVHPWSARLDLTESWWGFSRLFDCSSLLLSHPLLSFSPAFLSVAAGLSHRADLPPHQLCWRQLREGCGVTKIRIGLSELYVPACQTESRITKRIHLKCPQIKVPKGVLQFFCYFFDCINVAFLILWSIAYQNSRRSLRSMKVLELKTSKLYNGHQRLQE